MALYTLNSSRFILVASLLLSGLYVYSENVKLENDTLLSENITQVDVIAYKNKAKEILSLPTVNIPKTVFESPAFFTPADVLNREVGISLVRDGMWATTVNIRGLSKERLLFLVDDERILTATDVAGALSTVDMNNLERIEVIKGAGSVFYGSGAMGGIVNFITDRPAYTSSKQVHGRIGSGFNTVNNLWASHAKVQVSDNNWYMAANGSYRQAKNTKTPDGTLQNSQFNDASFGIQAGMLYNDNQEFRVNYQHFEAWNVGIPDGGNFPGGANVRYKNISRNLLSGEYLIYKPLLKLNEVMINIYTQNIARNVENQVNDNLAIFPSSDNAVSGGKVVTDWALQSTHRLVAGIEGWYRDAETKRYRRIKNSETKYTVTGEQPVPNAGMLDLGAFAQYSWKISPERFTFDAGLRLDYIHLKNDTAFNPTFKSVIENGKETIDNDFPKTVLFNAGSKNEFSYAVHADFIYTPAKRHKIVLSLSNAYRVASLEERFKFIDQGSNNPVQKGDPNLKPEKGFFSNLGYTYNGEEFILKTDVYANYLFDLITEKLKRGATRDTLMNVNVDKAFFVGAELEAVWRITANLNALANVSYTFAQDANTRKFLPQIPPLKGVVELNYHYRNFFSVSVSALWAARQFLAAKGESVTDGHVVLNATIQSGKIVLGPLYLQLFGGVDNLLNAAYYEQLAVARGIHRLEPGRNIYVKFQLGW